MKKLLIGIVLAFTLAFYIDVCADAEGYFDDRGIQLNYIDEESKADYYIEQSVAKLPSYCEAGEHDGRFVIPAVEIDVGYRFERDMYSWQWITNLPDTACLFQWHEGHLILADHKTEAFEHLIDVNVGDKAYCVTEDGVKELSCIDVFDGHNTNWDLTDWDYNSVTNEYELFCYTCLDWWENIRIVVFESTGNIKE